MHVADEANNACPSKLRRGRTDTRCVSVMAGEVRAVASGRPILGKNNDHGALKIAAEDAFRYAV